MKNLISMTDFVLSQSEGSTIDLEQLDWMNQEIYKLDRIRNYANFLKQPLELWMFIPCDEDGNVLKEDLFKNNPNLSSLKSYERIQYQQAKERCLFEGFEVYKGNPYNYHKARAFIKDYIEEKWTIEKIIHWELQLTTSAQRQIGL